MDTVTEEEVVSDEFEEIHAGRRLVLEYPMSPRSKIQAVVLDSVHTVGVDFVVKCAAMLVPSGQEAAWMYSSEGGQWQLIASAGVSRLILLSRKFATVQADSVGKRSHRRGKRMKLLEKQRGKRSSKEEEQQQTKMLIGRNEIPVVDTDDEVLKHILGPLVLALAPKISFDTGFPRIPFVSYTDNVSQRVVVEEVLSTLTGLMRVEDVELESEISALKVPKNCGGPAEEESSNPESKQSTRSWRRRLIFKRMPNLIQTEVLLTLQRLDSKRRVSHKGRAIDEEGGRFLKRKAELRQCQPDLINVERVVRQVDHSRLVHKYLPSIIAGFVLVAPRLDTFFMSDLGRARVLLIGVGGGALPIFLQKHFRFDIQAIDLDIGVLQLARKHFGLKEDAYFEVTVGDGVTVVKDIAARTVQEGLVDEILRRSWATGERNGGSAVSSPPHDLLYLPKTLEAFASPSSQELCFSKVACKSDGGSKKDDEKAVQQVEEEDFELLPPEILETSRKQMLDLYLPGQSEVSSSSNLPNFSRHEQPQSDPRVDLIILDVDVGDAQLGLSSPPQSFLERTFLISARIALQRGGMLAMNVVPCGEKPFARAINSLTAVFAEVYEIALEDDVNHVVFALPSPVSLNHDLDNSHTVYQVRKLVGGQIVKHIRRLSNLPSKE